MANNQGNGAVVKYSLVVKDTYEFDLPVMRTINSLLKKLRLEDGPPTQPVHTSAPAPSKAADEAVWALYQMGSEYLERRKFSAAKKTFTAAVNLCHCQERARSFLLAREDHPPCAVFHWTSDPKCFCKDWDAALEDQAGLGLLVVAKKQCQCGGYVDITRCSYEGHLLALSGRAAALAKVGDLEGARRDAQLMIYMAPRRGEGYARLQQVLRMQGKLELGRHAVKQAVSIVRDKQSKAYQDLQKIFVRFPFRDPARKLPPEIMLQILANLSVTELVACIRVSKHWQALICEHPILWQVLEIGLKCPSVPVGDYVLRAMCQRSQDRHTDIPLVKKLIIGNTAACGFTTFDLASCLDCLPQLTEVSLTMPAHANMFETPFWRTDPDSRSLFAIVSAPSLTRLHLDHVAQWDSGSLVALLKAVRGTLTELYISGCPEFCTDSANLDFQLEHLRYLLLCWDRDSPAAPEGQQHGVLDLAHLIQLAPNITQLLLQGWLIFRSETPKLPEDAWFQLQALVIGTGATSMRPRVENVFPQLPYLRMLDLLDDCFDFEWSENGKSSIREAPDLEHFRCGFATTSTHLTFLTMAMVTGKLRTLDLGAPAPGSLLMHFVGDDHEAGRPIVVEDSHRHVDRLDRWLTNKAPITTLGLSSFRWDNVASAYGQSFTGLPFVYWVRDFPNVHTVRCYPEHFEGAMATVRALLDIPTVKVIYQDCLFGVGRDEVLKLAKERGVTIVFMPKRTLPRWPYAPVYGDDESFKAPYCLEQA